MELKQIIHAALQEDIGAADYTTRLLIAPQVCGSATVTAKTRGVMSGIAVFTEVFRQLDESISVRPKVSDGQAVNSGEVVITLQGPLGPLLTGERVALNFLQRMSGIAMLTRSYVEAVKGTRAVILDTRKTTPNLRFLEKAAVVHGGGRNHRHGLYDMILIKDNHISACGGIAAAIERALSGISALPLPVENMRLPLEVEVKDLHELDEALKFAGDLERIMLDNFNLDTIRTAVDRTKGLVPLEVSGGVTLANVRDFALAGVDYISVGALTHSAPALDLKPADSAMNNGDLKILLGDTDLKNLQHIRKILLEESYSVWSSDDAGELVRIYDSGPFDLLILDVKTWANLNLQHFRVNLSQEGVPPIIIMTGDEDIAATIDAVKEGAVDFLEKPIRVKRLLLTIRNALQHNHKLKEMHHDQSELASLKEVYERIINGIDYGIVVLEPNLRIESINEHLRRKQRKELKQALGKPCYKFFYGQRSICDECKIKEVFEKGVPIKYNLVHKTAWSTEFHLEIDAYPLFDTEGRVHRVVQLIKDVTERVKLEHELREKKEYLESLLDHAPVGIFSTDSNGFVQAANPAFAEIYGVQSPFDLIGLNVLEWEDFKRNGLDEQIKSVLNQGVTVTADGVPCELTPGHPSICTLRCVPLRDEVGGISGLMATVENVTDKIKLEDSFLKRIAELSIFKEIGELLQSTVDLSDIYAITLIGVTAGRALGFNRAFILRYDRTSNVLVGETAIGPSDAAEAGRIWSELYEKQLSLKEIFDNYKESLGDKDARVRSLVKRLRIPLTWDEGLMQEVLFHNQPQRWDSGYRIQDSDNSGRIPTAESIPYEDARMIAAELGSPSFAVVPLISRGKAEGVVIADNLISGKEITQEDVNRLSIISNQAGAAIENSRLLQNLEEKVEALRLAYLDLKENRDLLLRAERLSAIGEMAAMVAHEIRNPLTSIGGFARAVLRDVEKSEKYETNRRFLNIILEEVKRLERIVTEILGFVRPVALKFTQGNLQEVVEQTFAMMAGEIDAGKVIITKDFQPDLPPVWMDADQIRQVLLNLFRNALHAMKNEGMLSCILEAAGDTVKIYISDTGPGIQPENLDKVFDAFFTTKSTGSGLGLTICMQIIRSHGGSIEVQSREGEGSTFIIALPLRTEETLDEKENSGRGRRKKPAPAV